MMLTQPTLTVFACVLGVAVVAGQSATPRGAPSVKSRGAVRLAQQMQTVFPSAQDFSSKQGSPPHFVAYGRDDLDTERQLGFIFWTTELSPLERGYDGPIKMLVGMDMRGVLTGLVVAEHHEPYGDFSVEVPAFANQFRNKSIRDGFKVGIDIDAVTRATITMTSAARAIKNSSRRMARQYLTPPSK
jgi:NosR/NirI family nitrous oxide reductase transcriptional regulator